MKMFVYGGNLIGFDGKNKNGRFVHFAVILLEVSDTELVSLAMVRA
jgi:hypothetical protein